MPVLKLKDIRKDLRWPELRLPEMSRDDISKALGEARKELIEVRKDLNEFRREMEMPTVDLSKLELPRIDVDSVANEARDVGKKVGKNAAKNAAKGKKQALKAAQAAGLVKKSSRKPFVLVGLVTMGLVGWAMSSPSVKTRIKSAAQQVRDQVRDRMAERGETWDRDEETRAFDAAEPAAVTPAPYSDDLASADSPFAEPPSALPKKLGKTNGSHKIAKDEPART